MGNFVNFLIAAGEDAAKIKSKGFDLSKLDSLEGNEVVVRVTRQEYPKDSGEYTNSVRGVKPAGSATGGGKRPSVL